jgi:hypothetical protein
MTVLKANNYLAQFCVGSFLLLYGCQGQNEAGRKTQLALESQLTAVEQVELIARIGDRRITLRDLERRLNEQPPFLRTLYGNSQRKIGLLVEWVRVHLLANEAVKHGLESADHVVEQTNAALVRALLDDLGRQDLRESPIAMPVLPDEGLDEVELEALRLRQQQVLLKLKEDAILTVLTEYDTQRRVTYRQNAWSKFKSNYKRSKDKLK